MLIMETIGKIRRLYYVEGKGASSSCLWELGT